MKKKALALAVAGAFFAPASYAAQDTAGMQYTSAAEGFYASIRARFATEATTNAGAGIGNSFSRFGIRGSNDLGNGLQGFYQYEAGVDTHNGGNVGTRLGQVGLEGAFGRVWAGSGWTETHNMTYGSTDVANHGSGNLTYTDLRPGRANNMIQYRTPDIGGFQAALGINLNAGSDNNPTYMFTGSGARTGEFYAEAADIAAAGGIAQVSYRVGDGKYVYTDANGTHVLKTYSASELTAGRNADGTFNRWENADGDALTPYNLADVNYGVGEACHPSEDMCAASPGDDNNVDMWSLAAQYSVQGFTAAFAYSVRPDTTRTNAAGVADGTDDATAWTARLGYAQDNWHINGWYGKDNTRDINGRALKDAKYASIAGGVSVGAVNLYAVYDAGHNGMDQASLTSILGVQYNLGSNSRVWMDYIGKDFDTDASQEDHIGIGLRHDF